ncbi:MAG: hypothetical protein PHH60_01510 [Candidatus Margulisbacteria bacterium]|nr:hypothetical protein [Candidatus Margulisiibacteriota bacterium]
MIPRFISIGGQIRVLPPGEHEATIDEVEARFALTDHRKHLFSGLKRGIDSFHSAGCKTLYLDGSFVTEKLIPKDYDACWDPNGVDPDRLDPILLDSAKFRLKQKEKYYGEYFPSTSRADSAHLFLSFFKTDRFTGRAKGIIVLRLK